MFTIKTLNAISPVGLAKLNKNLFDVSVGTDAPGLYRLYINGEEHPLPEDFCAQGGVLAYSLPDACPHATTAHRSFVYTEPTDGGIMLEHGDTARKYTVYAIETDGRMIVGDVTV